MEVSWKYDIQNGYAKIIPPTIPDRISLMLVNYNIATSSTVMKNAVAEKR
jgi:hypothetical protein